MNLQALEIERASLRAWPALESEALDGWELRFANGFTKRANSVQPFRHSTESLATKVARCEAWYAARGVPPIFRLTPFADPELDAFLQLHGYRITGRTAVLELRAPAVFEAHGMPKLRSSELEEWIAAYAVMSEMNGAPLAPMRSILEACTGERFLGVLPGAHPTTLLACGMAVRDGDLVGLFDLVTASAHRRQGFATTTIACLLRWGVSRGATRAYIQVVRTNTPAWALYESLGFEHSYDYWYRERLVDGRTT